MKSYLETIINKTESKGIKLKDAFTFVNIADSTYYRTINGVTELRYETAKKIFDGIDEKIKRDKHVERTKRMREADQKIDKRVFRY
jgi:predicted transcriptional regulator